MAKFYVRHGSKDVLVTASNPVEAACLAVHNMEGPKNLLIFVDERGFRGSYDFSFSIDTLSMENEHPEHIISYHNIVDRLDKLDRGY